MSLTKIIIAIFAPDERLPSSATLLFSNIVINIASIIIFPFFSLRHLSGLSGGVPSWPESWTLFSLTPNTHLLIERFGDFLTISNSNLYPPSNATRMSLQCAACTVASVCLPWSGWLIRNRWFLRKEMKLGRHYCVN